MNDDKNKIGLVVVAAGSGTRFGGPKQFMLLAGKPVLAHCLLAFDSDSNINERIVVLPQGVENHAIWRSIERQLQHPVRVVSGGNERRDSVLAGVQALNARCDLVVVHDGARPFVPANAYKECCEHLRHDVMLAACIVASPVSDTLKMVNGARVGETIDRTQAVRAETPQVCRTNALIEALEQSGQVTDEAQALEQMNLPVRFVLHSAYNVKITNPSDIVMAEAWLEHNMPGAGCRPCYRGEVDV